MKQMPSSETEQRVVEKYEAEGYKVVVQPSPKILPFELGGYVPDILAEKGNEHVLVEIVNRSMATDNTWLLRTAEFVRSKPGWRLDVVVHEGEPEHEPTRPRSLSSKGAMRRMQTARTALDSEDPGAALLLAWTALEASIRHALVDEDASRSVAPLQLVKLAESLGIVDEDERRSLNQAAILRNAVAHGFSPIGLNRTAVDKHVRLIDTIVSRAESPSAKSA